MVYNKKEVIKLESYIIIILIFALILLLSLIVLYFINQILRYKMIIDNSFISIKKNIDELNSLTNDILEFLNNNLEHEKSYYKRLNKAKEKIITIKNNKDGINELKLIEKEVLSFINLENTYKYLSKNKDYLKIKEELINNKDRLIYAFENYDKGVISYNKYKENKYINLLSKIIKVPEYICYNK